MRTGDVVFLHFCFWITAWQRIASNTTAVLFVSLFVSSTACFTDFGRRFYKDGWIVPKYCFDQQDYCTLDCIVDYSSDSQMIGEKSHVRYLIKVRSPVQRRGSVSLCESLGWPVGIGRGAT